ncbi:SpoIIE family protein phosphatase [Streptomyces sp. NPDC056987]|uniref:SpoIIE family protein phosphatase n=1 Tax=Streptomyces sp. NPDC056987 TaxID=3345988 RepID=UPI00364239E3
MNPRLALLSTAASGTPESEVFRLALQHAAGELCALGGMIHLCGPTSGLCLASAVGLPSALTGSWEIIDEKSPLAPARALRRGAALWLPPLPAEAADSPGPTTGMAALPVSGGGRIMGTLTVLTGDRSEPTPEQWDFLRAVVAWAEERMARAPKMSEFVPKDPDGDRSRQNVPGLRVGWWDWNLQTDELIWDAAVMELYGSKSADFTGKVQDWMHVLHPDDLAPTMAEAQRAIREHSVYEAVYRVRRLDGTYGWSRARGMPTYDDSGRPLRMVGVRWENSESLSARDALSRALRQMGDGFLAVDAKWRVIFTNLEAEHAMGLSQDETFGRVLWDLPAARRIKGLERRCRKAAAEKKPVSFDALMPDTGRRYRLRLVPGPVGCALYLSDVTEKLRMQEERRAAERAASERAAQIMELTAALAKATTSQDVVDAVARRVLPPFDAVGLMVQAIEGNRLLNVGSVGYADDFLDVVNDRVAAGTSPSWQVVSSGVPAFLSSRQEYAAYAPDHADLPAIADKQAWAFLPLTASGRTFGVCVVSFDRPRRLTDDERSLLTTISALVAQALERARLYDAERVRSRELQRSLLPTGLPDLAACVTAARYLPAGQGMDVGGDWYDVIPLSSGQVALVVGDVMGHGLPEAAAMGRLRTAVRTLADLELPPDEIMGHLNDIVGEMGDESYVTCLYALYDSTTQVCSITHAGHPPPALVYPDGTVRFPELGADPPLGAAEPPFETVELTVPEGTLVVLYTDGLVESAKRDIDTGMADLARLLRTAHADGGDADLERLCDTLTAGLLPAEHQAADDAAVLVARLHALNADRMASWPLTEEPKAASLARRYVREQLSVWGLDDLTSTTELLASELVGNVVRHAKGPVSLRLLHGAELICEVFDGSLTMPRMRRAADTDEGGRGLQLITALSQRWGSRYTAKGKCIWTEQALHGLDGRGNQSSDALELMLLSTGGFDGTEGLDVDLNAPSSGEGER